MPKIREVIGKEIKTMAVVAVATYYVKVADVGEQEQEGKRRSLEQRGSRGRVIWSDRRCASKYNNLR